MSDKQRKYRAPALEKGLDVLELLAAAREPMLLNGIAAALGRSVSQLFRMIQVLEFRGYVENSETGTGYVLSNRLFALGMSRAPTADVVDAALPVMRRLAEQIWQSCHLAVPSGDQIVIVARVEAPGDLGFSVRVGHRRDFVSAGSGMVLYGSQPESIRSEWRAKLGSPLSKTEWHKFEKAAAAAHEHGFVRLRSRAVEGIIDIAAPVMQQDRAVASLSVPYVKTRKAQPQEETTRAVVAGAAEISALLRGWETRPKAALSSKGPVVAGKVPKASARRRG